MYRGLIVGFAAVLLAAGPAGAADQAAVKDACTKSTGWTEKACQCLADKSASLSPAQRDYVVAILVEDSAGAAKAEAALTIPQFSAVSGFLVNAGTDCEGD